MAKEKTKISETLDSFLFRKIQNDPAYILWAKDYQIPEYITDNLRPSKRLRDYQIEALKHFIWLYEKDRILAKHLLFNMATGTGKTLIMASCILYLYDKGYRNFIFLVHRDQILKQAQKNFTDYKFGKYLFNPNGIKMNGRRVNITTLKSITETNKNDINFLFISQQTLINRLSEEKENSLTHDDFANNNIVIIADEAHSLNADTRSSNKTEASEARHWETSVLSTLKMREENILLEFTATVDLANENIHKKYEDKLLYRYDFLQFNKDGYSKDVKFLYNFETQIEDQKRLLIVNAVALSEFRKVFAQRTMKAQITPVVLIKSVRIAGSEKDRDFFDEVISTLRPEDLKRLKEISKNSRNHEHEILDDMFTWLKNPKNGFVTQGDWEGLRAFTTSIRMSFARDNTLIYNSHEKEKAELLPQLDSPLNNIRAIFSVNALNEGWDVLSLYDIVHFDISESKKVSLQDIQLIGRGARYFPYELPKEYRGDDDDTFFGRDLELDRYKRKFDQRPYDTGRVLETFVYHFVKTGTFLENLRRDLLGEGIISEHVEQKIITLKENFLKSDTYKKGFVLVNHTEKRDKTTDDDIDTTFNRVIKAGSYNLRSGSLSDAEENQRIESQKTRMIHITEEYFSRPTLYKALISAENNFFRFENIREHVIGIESVDELINTYLPLYEIKYSYEEGKDINQLNAQEKLQLLVGVILPEVRRAIDLNMPKVMGSTKFRPISLAHIFQKEKSIYLASFPSEDPVTGQIKYKAPDERAKEQTTHDNPELRYNIQEAEWYAYDENYGTSEEKRFVKYIATQIDNLHRAYPVSEIYVIRNEMDYSLFSPREGRRFSPDFLLFINDVANKKMYYQCLIEVKGGHLLEHDSWKEEALIELNENSQVVFDIEDSEKHNYREYLEEIKKRGYHEIKNIGLRFFNTDTRGVEDFALDFQGKLEI